uniref:Uncharacterized protein n=1 Tax=Arundo donax TaxID=35708 RepID=A0A0A9H8T1_ARUDO
MAPQESESCQQQSYIQHEKKVPQILFWYCSYARKSDHKLNRNQMMSRCNSSKGTNYVL